MLIIIIFFSIIEADIFYYNQFYKYQNYKDRQSFKDKFESTFPKVCTSSNRLSLQQAYFAANLDTILKLRGIRNNLAHPKASEHVFKATLQDVEELKTAFNNYNEFIRGLMTNFMFEFPAKNQAEYDEAIKILLS